LILTALHIGRQSGWTGLSLPDKLKNGKIFISKNLTMKSCLLIKGTAVLRPAKDGHPNRKACFFGLLAVRLDCLWQVAINKKIESTGSLGGSGRRPLPPKFSLFSGFACK
jgi:hypothetical protein